jgi:hypothetical protein
MNLVEQVANAEEISFDPRWVRLRRRLAARFTVRRNPRSPRRSVLSTRRTEHRQRRPAKLKILIHMTAPQASARSLSPGVVASQGHGTSMTSPLGMVWGDDVVRRGSSRFTAWSGVESQNTHARPRRHIVPVPSHDSL